MDDPSGLIGNPGSGGSLDTAKLGGLAKAVQDEGGLDGLMGKLQGAGLGDAVDSWVGAGPNATVDPQQLGAALGDDEVQRLSSKSGLDVGALLPLLAAFLPQIIDMLTPNGTVPNGGLDQAAQGQAGDLGGLLGGLLGGGSGAGGDDLAGMLGGLLGGNKGQ
jgi:uncharacterized protein YidB (DUF937 family)